MPEKWQACSFPVDIESLKGKVCYGGLDLSSNTDTTALVWVFPPQEGLYEDKFTVLARFFVPKDNLIERVRRDRVPYDVWEQQGYIVTTDGNIVDENFILAQIDQDTKDFDVRELCYDRWGASKIITALHDMGFENPQENKRAERRLIEFGQGVASMSPPSKELEKLILSQKLAHGGNPVLTWQISNVVIRTDPAGNIKPDKEKSRERIDGAVAMIMGLARAVLCNHEKSVYEERGILTI
jgi:phage terminase large subunit-like protein